METKINRGVSGWLVFMLTLMCFVHTGCSDGTSKEYPDPLLADLPAHIEKRMAEWKTPGVAVGVIKDGKVIFKRGFGYRDVENKLPVTTETMFPIASCSKAFTALSVEMAGEAGILDMDAPLNTYLTDFKMHDPEATLKVTVRDFLEHRTGLSGYGDMPLLTRSTRDEVFQKLKYFEPDAPYRERFIYSNLGYVMAAQVLAMKSDQNWEDFVKDNILLPLQMKSTCFTIEEMVHSEDYAIPYVNLMQEEPKRGEKLMHHDTYTPAGGVISNLEDMLRWVQFSLNNGKVGNRQMIEIENLHEMWTPHTKFRSGDDYTSELGYGYGWYSQDYRGHRMIYHGGLGFGYISQISFMPDEGIGVVFLSNMYYHHLEQVLTYEIYDLLLGLSATNLNEENLNACKGIEQTRQRYHSFWDRNKQLNISEDSLNLYSGVYQNDLYGRIDLQVKGEVLILSFLNGDEAELRYISENTFGTESDTYSLSHQKVPFMFDKRGVASSLTLSLDGGSRKFERLLPN